MWGWQEQLNTVSYRLGWQQVSDRLQEADTGNAALFLPWHQYMDYNWLPQSQQRLKAPASHYFDIPLVALRNMERGSIYSQEVGKPVQQSVEDVLFLPGNKDLDFANEDLAQALASWDVHG